MLEVNKCRYDDKECDERCQYYQTCIVPKDYPDLAERVSTRTREAGVAIDR